ncbi:outer membrane beta-barrel protein [Winogradskyella sp.]
MKNILVLFLLVLVSTSLKAQEYSFGLMLGTNIYSMNLTSGDGTDLGVDKGITPFNLGLFGTKKIGEQSGIRLNIFYGQSVERGFFSDNISTGKINIQKLNLQLLYKYYPSKVYGEGKYLLAGPRMTLINSAERRDDGFDFTDLYNDSNFGLNAGLGFHLTSQLNIEFLIDYGLPNIVNIGDNKVSSIGAFLNVLFNIESLISK